MVAALRFRFLQVLIALAVLFAMGATAASAETLMMPPRDAKKGVPVVVWGISTLANGTAFTLDYGDGSPQLNSTVGDRSYIAVTHTYSAAGNFTATLTVGGESATVKVSVFDTALLSAENVRSLGINMAIQDGLRWLWFTEQNRAIFNLTGTAIWNGGSGFAPSYTSFVTLAFENHGYKAVKSDGSPATDIYGKYAVRRGLNYVISNLATIGIGSTSKQRFDPTTYALTNYTDDPCQGLTGTSDPCVGLYNTNDNSYQTAVAMLALAGSGAMNKINTEVGGYTNGKTYKEILQRMANAQVFGQEDSGAQRGGWCYYFNQGCGDGSTLGWAVLGLLDAEAAGVVIPQFVKEELKYQVGWQKPDKTVVLNGYAINSDGGLDYRADNNSSPGSSSAGIEKGGIPLQAYYLTGQTAAYFLGHDPANETELRSGLVGTFANNTLNYLNNQWNTATQVWGCGVSDYIRGCSYAMFNAFKGLKLTGITTMSNSTRAAGPGSLQAHDWYAELQDYLVGHQQNPTTTGGGFFPANWSCCDSAQPAIQAIAELVLSPVALVLPDETKFSTVGLTHVVGGIDSTAADSAIEGGSHTVTAKAESSNGTPVAGATVAFTVISGPNAGASGSAVTGSNGKASFTYASPYGNLGLDTVQAAIGTLVSNSVARQWLPRTPTTTAVVCPVSVPYNGSAQTPCTATTYETANPSNVIVASAVVSYSANVNPGTVTASASYAGNATYGPSTGSSSFDITKIDPVIVVNGYTGVYDGLQHGATGTATGLNGANLNALLDLGQTFANVPGGTANWVFAGNAFYNAAAGTAAIEITPRPVTVKTNNATKIYGSGDPAFGGSLLGFILSDNVTATYDRVAGETVLGGPYTIAAHLAPLSVLGNYNITYDLGALTITAKPASVTPEVKTKVYGQADPPIGYTLIGFLPADGVTATISRTPGQNVGTYTSSATLSPAAVLSNYAITYNTANFTITPAVLTFQPGPVGPGSVVTRTYGDSTPNVVVKVSGLVNGDSPATASTGAPSLSVSDSGPLGNPTRPVGTYALTLTQGSLQSQNYTFNFLPGSLVVVARNASVTPNAATKVYGSADPAFSGTLTGFVASDNVTATYSRTAGEAAGGAYTISATLAPAAVLGNYNITYKTAPFTITKKAASVTPDAATKVYGSADPALTGTLAGFEAADGVTASYSRTTGETVGSYTISAALAPAGVLSNYDITYNTAQLTITKKAASVTPAGQSKTYGDADPALTGATAGFEAADGVTASYSRVAGETVGSYTISAALAPAGVLSNYDITYNTAQLTITKKAASVTPNPGTKEYGSADPGLTGSTAGFLVADNVTASYSRTAGETVLGGPYTISAALAPNSVLSNYDITYNTALFTITVKAASVTPNAATKTYGDADPALTGSTAGFLAADNVTASYSRTSGNVVGSYTISATLAPVGVLSNYAITYNTAAFTITKKATSTSIVSGTNPAAVGPVTFTATVVPQVGPQPTTGTVTFYDGATVIGTSTVNGSGVATLTTSTLAVGYHTISASYSGDDNYLASTTTQNVNQLIYAFASPTGGTFVIGDLNAAVGTNVTFWGAQWEKLNSLTGGAANASFKGFANAILPAPAKAGGAWQTDPGNSSNPPAGQLPAYVGIIVTSKVNKAGSTISGGIVKVVVVKTNAGYDANPGHAGTGTVVAVAP